MFNRDSRSLHKDRARSSPETSHYSPEGLPDGKNIDTDWLVSLTLESDPDWTSHLQTSIRRRFASLELSENRHIAVRVLDLLLELRRVYIFRLRELHGLTVKDLEGIST